MHAWEAIESSIQTLENNLDSPPGIDALAAAAGLSPFYFQRLFTRLVGCPVGEYTRLRRLARATKWLARGDKVLDVALASGFESHEGFTRAFKAAYGLTPEAYRKKPVWLNHFERPDLKLGYTLVEENVPLVAEGVVLEITRRTLAQGKRFLGLTRQISIAQNTPPGASTGMDSPGLVWDEFHRAKPDIPGLADDGEEWGFSFFGGAKEGFFSYFAGAEALPDAVAARGLTEKALSAGEYLAVVIEAESQEQLLTQALNTALNYLFCTWLPQNGLASEAWSAERYLPPEKGAHRIELWVRPLKK